MKKDVGKIHFRFPNGKTLELPIPPEGPALKGAREMLEAAGFYEYVKKMEAQRCFPGNQMADGSIYLGYHAGKDWFVAAEDARDERGERLALTFNQAAAYAKKLDVHGHKDWMLPPGFGDEDGEADIAYEMFRHGRTGAFRGTYCQDNEHPLNWYWSSSQDNRRAWQHHMTAPRRALATKKDKAAVRCVRSVRRPISGL